jgi:hypothetical protein
MTVLVSRNPDLFAAIGWTPDIDGGVGPVKIGELLVEAGETPRYACIHPFGTIDEAWIAAYCTGETPEMLILGAMPADWRYPEGLTD